MRHIIRLLLCMYIFTLFSACGPAAIVSTPITAIDPIPLKTTPLNETQLKTWPYANLVTDTIPGMSIDLAYKTILHHRKGEKVIVGVIDSGMDITHEDLKNVIWINEKEIPNNNKDDDNNGYTDDIHGWNFLGDALYENLEFVRIIKKGDDGSSLYKQAKEEYDQKYQEALQNKMRYDQILKMVNEADAVIRKEVGTEVYTKEQVKAITSEDPNVQQAVNTLMQMYTYEDTVSTVKEQLNEGINHFAQQLNYRLNMTFDGRAVIGDNPDDINDINYGNNNVIGPDKDETTHGTHVAGIIAAQRNNNIGINGIAENVAIMVLRAVPDGDEYDKDIALAIRYAADNGARVINTSFGKYYSPHSDWVKEAIRYAAAKDVLIVNAAGNEANNIDEIRVYPNAVSETASDTILEDNFLTVGALNYDYGSNMIAPFSNYGKNTVDIFAPGMKIWSTAPNNTYKFLQGTSMAAPAVAGIAALIRSYFPKLTATQVKRIIMQSGLSSKSNVILGGNPNDKKALEDISVSGKMANLYNALILADKVSRKKITL